jgi:glycosyltransferase involved in cell wall biosynthesis
VKPRVSVVIPCYNAAGFLEETVDSVLAQTLAGFELVIADDGSTDQSVEVAHRLIDANPDKRIRVVELAHAGHPSSTRNGGIARAAGELVLCLDADDKLTPPFLERCVAALDANPGAAIAYTDQQDFGASEERHTVPEYDFQMLTRHNCFGIASVFRRQAWEEVGGFDPTTPYEDWNFWIACGVLGYHGVKVHGVEWLYRVRDNGRFKTYGSLRDRRTKARFVARRPGLYTHAQLQWAQLVLSDHPAANQIQDSLGVIPEFRPSAAPQVSVGTDEEPRVSVRAGDGPRVSVVIPAFNLAHYLPAALDSALAQESVGGSIEVIVVDDGSTDDTPAVLASYGDRIRSVRQPNGGLVAAVAHGLELVTGEYVALLDADDQWPRDRLLRHLAALDASSGVGLVHGDMTLTDADGSITDPSFFRRHGIVPTDGRALGRLIADNFVSGGASTFRSALLPAVLPMPEQAAYPDWWIAVCAAAVSEIALVDGTANLYRFHGANMGLGAGHDDNARILGSELRWRQWMLGDLSADDTVAADDLRRAAARLNESIAAAARFELAGPDPSITAVVQAALDRKAALVPAAASPALLQLATRARLSLAWLDEVVANPQLLASFADDAVKHRDATLAVLAPASADLGPLVTLFEHNELLRNEDCDVTVISEPVTTPARRLLAARASARLTLSATESPYDALPLDAAIERAGRAAPDLGGPRKLAA